MNISEINKTMGLVLERDLYHMIREIMLYTKSGPCDKYVDLEHFRRIATLMTEEPGWIIEKASTSIFTKEEITELGNSILFHILYTKELTRYLGQDSRNYIRVYEGKPRVGMDKVRLKTKTLPETNVEIESSHEYDVIHVVKWLIDWKEPTDQFTINNNNLLNILELIDKGDKENLFNIHFGSEYTNDDKMTFNNTVKDMIEALNKIKNKELTLSINYEPIHNCDNGYDVRFMPDIEPNWEEIQF